MEYAEFMKGFIEGKLDDEIMNSFIKSCNDIFIIHGVTVYNESLSDVWNPENCRIKYKEAVNKKQQCMC